MAEGRGCCCPGDAGQAQSSPAQGYLALLQLPAAGPQLPARAGAPGAAWPLSSPGSHPEPRVWGFPLAPHLRGTEGRRSSAQVGGTGLPLNRSSRRSRSLHGPTLVVYELQVLEVLQRSRAGVGITSPGTSEC